VYIYIYRERERERETSALTAVCAYWQIIKGVEKVMCVLKIMIS